MEYEKYPMIMTHSGHKLARKISDAILGGPGAPNNGFGMPEQWEPERFPQISVTNADDEQYYAAKGYKPAGQPNAAAFSTAHASPHVPGRTHSEWPKMIDGKLVQDPNAPSGGGFQRFPMWMNPPDGGDAILVETQAHEQELLARWTDPDAKGPRDAVASDFQMLPEVTATKLKKNEQRVE